MVQLAVLNGLADAVDSLEARTLAGFFVRGGSLDADWPDYFARFSIVISYLHDPNGVFRENVTRCSAAELITGPHRPDDGSRRHATEVLLQPLERLGIFNAPSVPRLVVPVSSAPSLPPGRWLALHPGSGSELKNWPEENWRGLVAGLVETTDLKLLLVGGEAEGERLKRLAAPIPLERVQLAQSLPLSTLAAQLNYCLGFVGHDSGISHLAAAVGLPGIVLWGPTVAEVWKPLGKRISVVSSSRGIAGIAMEDVLEQARRLPEFRE